MTQTFGPYTPVRKAGNFYYVSGQVGINPTTKAASANVGQQTHEALSNMKNVLAEQGLSMDDVVKTTIFVTDINDFTTVNSVYERSFKAPRPARSTVQVAALPKVADDVSLLVEVEAVAYREQ